MIKLVYCIVKAAELSQAEFHRYWLEEHGPRVRGHAAALGAKRYVQSHTLRSEVGAGLNDALQKSRACGEPYDGITEVWWPDTEGLGVSLASEAGRAAGLDLLIDERKFIDLEASRVFVTEEHEIFDL